MKIIAASLLFVGLLLALPAQAQRIIFQQDATLYTTAEDGQEPRPLLTMDKESIWAASPDGRRIAFLTRRGAKGDAEPGGLKARPAIVRLSDLTGRRQKLLFSTDRLRDRQGKAISLLAVPLSSGSEGNGTGSLEEWEPVSLSWSADGRTLYLSCRFLPNGQAKAMFAVDATTGIAVIDGEGRWKNIAPVVYAEARGGLIIGSGFGQYRPTPDAPVVYFSPLVAVNLIEGNRQPLFRVEKGREELPDYAFAITPALAPANRAIVFNANNKGLWLTDKFGKSYRRLLDGNALRPRWTADGKNILCLLPRPLTGEKLIYDLYRIPVPEQTSDEASTTAAPASPTTFTLLLQGVDWFDTVAE